MRSRKRKKQSWQPLRQTRVSRKGVEIPLPEDVDEVWGNNFYTVTVRRTRPEVVRCADHPEFKERDCDSCRQEALTDGAPELVHLSIHDHQRSSRHDWRDL